jgi:NAD-dependent deacetylase
VTEAEELDQQLNRAAQLFRTSRKVVAFTGAGLSVPSGIPDFRSASTGLWNQFDPMEVASLSAFRNRPADFFAWLEPLAARIMNAKPNPAHAALAEMQTSGYLQTIITQNIDGFLQKAGASDVIELHGNMDHLICPECRTEYLSSAYRASWLELHQLPHCPQCNALLKPDIVLYEEMLPINAWEQAEFACQQADLILIAGTSLEVMPAASLPLEGFHHGAKLIIMNLSSTLLDSLADVVMPLDVEVGLPALGRKVLS